MLFFPINKEKSFIFNYVCENNSIPKELLYFILNILYNSQKPKILIPRELSPYNKISRFWVVENFVPDYPDINIISKLLLQEPQIIVYGKVCHQNRNIGFFSNQSKGYKYSNQTIKSQPLDKYEPLKNLLSQVNDYLGTTFNGILVNEYINGTKYLGAHSDSELGLDKSTQSVAGISFGATRKFRIRENN